MLFTSPLFLLPLPKIRILPMTIVKKILKLLLRFKYIVAIVLAIIIIGFVDENSVLRFINHKLQISEMKDEIEVYKKKHEENTRLLKTLMHDNHAIQKVARERYFMKAADEDVFVFSTDVEALQKKKLAEQSGEITE